ncbi:MAG: hypothetical protein OD918_04520 [Gammaproteobacteria bacterium]
MTTARKPHSARSIADEILAARNREFCVPEDFRDRTLFDALADVFTPPEDLELHKPDCGWLAQIRDGHRIREDFRKAFAREDEAAERGGLGGE